MDEERLLEILVSNDIWNLNGIINNKAFFKHTPEIEEFFKSAEIEEAKCTATEEERELYCDTECYKCIYW